MTCRDMDRILLDIEESAAPLPLDGDVHLRECPRCQKATLAFRATPIGGEISPAILQKIERRLGVGLHPVRPLAPKPVLFAAFALIFVLAASVAGFRASPLALTVMSSAQAVGIFSVVALVAGLSVNSLTALMVPGSKHFVAPGRVPMLVSVVLALGIVTLFQVQDESKFWAHSWICLRFGALIGLAACAPMLLLSCRGAALSPSLSGAVIGTLAGLAGTGALEIHCPNLNALHIGISHLGVVPLGTLVGLISGWGVETLREN